MREKGELREAQAKIASLQEELRASAARSNKRARGSEHQEDELADGLRDRDEDFSQGRGSPVRSVMVSAPDLDGNQHVSADRSGFPERLRLLFGTIRVMEAGRAAILLGHGQYLLDMNNFENTVEQKLLELRSGALEAGVWA